MSRHGGMLIDGRGTKPQHLVRDEVNTHGLETSNLVKNLMMSSGVMIILIIQMLRCGGSKCDRDLRGNVYNTNRQRK